MASRSSTNSPPSLRMELGTGEDRDLVSLTSELVDFCQMESLILSDLGGFERRQ